ncbi:branched-chain amino acid ABC transporter permease [Hydrogenophaga sp. SNF1]|uniref:branched-chain amino acid ABC transporter permease n=1 Tax=Hydrogenophaga sp. SNF1 TaxID=3098762 RepID=UPI002ACC1839|nr:branched-chain amino acid ABC transporter permease [Hydrogenophaga sp. SNF1]WQB83740.1 branched-chain amino acid ABC transporter permease [Hydrogenophaga sp. SNF1]
MRIKHSGWRVPAVLAVVLAIAPFTMPVNIANEIVVMAIFAMAANLIIGVAGLYSFGHATFFGIGAYMGGYFLAQYGTSTLTTLVIATVAGAASAALMGAIVIRRTGFYFMMLTFAFNQMAFYVVLTWSNVTGGEDGMGGISRTPLGLPGLGSISLDDRHVFYALCATVFIASFYVLNRVKRSALGLVLESAKENPRRTASIGYSVYQAQITAFAISGAFAGLAGALYALLYRFVPVDTISLAMSGNVVFMIVIGGLSSMVGPLIGAAVFVWLQGLFSLVWARWALLFGLFIVLVVFTMPKGLVGAFEQLRTAWAQRKGGRA